MHKLLAYTGSYCHKSGLFIVALRKWKLGVKNNLLVWYISNLKEHSDHDRIVIQITREISNHVRNGIQFCEAPYKIITGIVRIGIRIEKKDNPDQFSTTFNHLMSTN